MSATTVTASTVTCARCSRVTADATGNKWRVDSPPLVVQGVTLGLCVYCMTGQPAPGVNDKHCDGTCSGDYKPQSGTYYEAVWGDSFDGERYSCWDPKCVEEWADEQDSDCHCCGQMVDVRVTKYIDGKAVRK